MIYVRGEAEATLKEFLLFQQLDQVELGARKQQELQM